MTPGREAAGDVCSAAHAHDTCRNSRGIAARGRRASIRWFPSRVSARWTKWSRHSVAAPRALAVLLLGFGGLAVVIGAVGVYSLIAYIVSWRTQEIGLRLALGAQRWQIVLAVDPPKPACSPEAAASSGLAGAMALSRTLRSFLFEVSALDPVTFCAVPLLMAIRRADRGVDSCAACRRCRPDGGAARRLGGSVIAKIVRYGSGYAMSSARTAKRRDSMQSSRATSRCTCEEGVRAGLSEEEARRQALIRLGGAEQTRQAYRDRATLPWLESFLRDVRYALRGFRTQSVLRDHRDR